MSNQHRRLVSTACTSDHNSDRDHIVCTMTKDSTNNKVLAVLSKNTAAAPFTSTSNTMSNHYNKKTKLNTAATTLHPPPPTSVVEDEDEAPRNDCHNNINVKQDQNARGHAEAIETNQTLLHKMEHVNVLTKRQGRYQPCIDLFSLRKQDEHHQQNNLIQMYRQRRQILCDWVIRVVHYFHLPTSTIVAHAMNLIDRFVAVYHKDLILKHSSSSDDKLLESSNCSALKLITTTALFIALKLYQGNSDGMRGHANLTSIVPFMSNGEFSLEKIEQFEMILIKTLGFFVSNPPLPIHFVAEYLEVLPSITTSSQDNRNKLIMEYSDMFCQMVIRDDHDEENMMVISNKYKPSIIGMACLFNGMKLAGMFLKQQQQNEQDYNTDWTSFNTTDHDSLMKQLLYSSSFGHAAPSPVSKDKKRKRAHRCPQEEEEMEHVKHLQQILWKSYVVRQRQKQQAAQQPGSTAAASLAINKNEDQGRHVSISPTSVVESVAAEGQQQQQQQLLRPRPPAA